MSRLVDPSSRAFRGKSAGRSLLNPPSGGRELHQASEGLCGGGEEEFFGRSGQSSETQATQFEVPLQVREKHFDLLPPHSGGILGICAYQFANRLSGLRGHAWHAAVAGL